MYFRDGDHYLDTDVDHETYHPTHRYKESGDRYKICIDSECSTGRKTCIDTDGGNVPDAAGTATDSSGAKPDYCEDDRYALFCIGVSKTLHEYYCEDGVVKETTHECADTSWLNTNCACHEGKCGG